MKCFQHVVESRYEKDETTLYLRGSANTEHLGEKEPEKIGFAVNGRPLHMDYITTTEYAGCLFRGE